ncbi:MAG TPA: hypothetical protein ENL03_04050, partial [Phycisphaerae bacterium]|nr:hypothetical protein [Phycisphaerae bacterium]
MPGWGAIRNNTLSSLRQYADKMARLQEQASSGMRVIRASDSPSDAFRIMNLHGEYKSYETYSKNLQSVTFNMGQISTSIQEIVTALSRARTLTTQAASGTYNAENRRLAALEIDAILENAVSLSNSKSMGRYVFGGSNLDDKPFEVTRIDGLISAVRYNGSPSELSVEISPGIDYGGTVVGSEFARSQAGGRATMVASTTGSAIGGGTSSARGDLWLSIAHDTTSYSDPALATGITAGTASSADDTIVGAHTLTISSDGSVNTIKLDGGSSFAFTNETNLRVVNDDGDEVYVDVSGWTGVTGPVNLSATALASIDGGITQTAIDLTNTSQPISAADGSTLYTNFTNTVRTGSDPIRMAGSYDLFGTLINL